MAYVDGFLLPIPKKNLAAYKKMAKWGAKMWIKHGALDYKECWGDDLNPPMGVSLLKMAGAKKTDNVVFAYIVYKSRAHRDAVNKRVMSDPVMGKMPKKMPFDCTKMGYGGFKVIVAGKARKAKATTKKKK